MDKLIIANISNNLEIATSLAEKIYFKMEPFVDFSEISQKELLETAKEWREYFTSKDRKQLGGNNE